MTIKTSILILPRTFLSKAVSTRRWRVSFPLSSTACCVHCQVWLLRMDVTDFFLCPCQWPYEALSDSYMDNKILSPLLRTESFQTQWGQAIIFKMHTFLIIPLIVPLHWADFLFLWWKKKNTGVEGQSQIKWRSPFSDVCCQRPLTSDFISAHGVNPLLLSKKRWMSSVHLTCAVFDMHIFSTREPGVCKGLILDGEHSNCKAISTGFH